MQAPEGPKGPPGAKCAPRGVQCWGNRARGSGRFQVLPHPNTLAAWEGMESREGELTATLYMNLGVTVHLRPHLHPAGKFTQTWLSTQTGRGCLATLYLPAVSWQAGSQVDAETFFKRRLYRPEFWGLWHSPLLWGVVPEMPASSRAVRICSWGELI